MRKKKESSDVLFDEGGSFKTHAKVAVTKTGFAMLREVGYKNDGKECVRAGILVVLVVRKTCKQSWGTVARGREGRGRGKNEEEGKNAVMKVSREIFRSRTSIVGG